MILALLDSRKTQTRRALGLKGRLNIFEPGVWTDDYVMDPGNADWRSKHIPIQDGDRLWVRESLRAASSDQGARWLTYAADGKDIWPTSEWTKPRDTVPSIHMPRWASRLTLYVTDVRVQRLQDISEADAIAEGIEKDHAAGMPSVWGWRDYLRGNDIAKRHFADPCESYRTLWNSINGPGAWEANPWVAAYTFEVWQGNIDGLPSEVG